MSVPTTLSTHNRVADVGRGLLALVGAAVLVVGVPAALLWWVGSPLPAEMPSLSEVTDALRDTYIPDEFLVKALALVCWVVWVELLASLLVESVAYVRGRKAGSVPLAGGLQRGAARLVATVALLGVLFATRGMHDGPGQPLASVSPPAVSFVTDLERTTGHPTMGPETPAPAAVEAPTYSVQRRDTLWDIAERHLGDPFRWREVFELNQGRPQADGRCLTDPDLIYAGWQLELPADAVGLTPEPAPASGTTGGAHPTAAPSADAARSPMVAPDADPSTAAGVDGMVLIDDGGKASGGVTRDDAVLASGANGPTHSFEGMVLLPPTGPLADDPSDPALAGPDDSGADELASPAEAAADRHGRSHPD